MDKKEDAIERIENKVDKILDILNGPDGIVTKVELTRQSNRRLWVFGIIVFTSMVGLFFK